MIRIFVKMATDPHGPTLTLLLRISQQQNRQSLRD